MKAMKIGLIVLAGFGATWAVRAATEALFGVKAPPTFSMPAVPATPGAQSAGNDAKTAPPAQGGQPPASDAKSAPAKVPEMSQQEMDAELSRAQKELGTPGKEAELREFRPTKPLPADISVALPSDI